MQHGILKIYVACSMASCFALAFREFTRQTKSVIPRYEEFFHSALSQQSQLGIRGYKKFGQHSSKNIRHCFQFSFSNIFRVIFFVFLYLGLKSESMSFFVFFPVWGEVGGGEWDGGWEMEDVGSRAIANFSKGAKGCDCRSNQTLFQNIRKCQGIIFFRKYIFFILGLGLESVPRSCIYHYCEQLLSRSFII